MESFSPQGRRAPLPFSMRLREGASPWPRRGAMATLRLRLRLGAPFTTMVSTLFSISTPKSTSETRSHLGWKQAMAEEMYALSSNGTWELVALPLGKSPVGCR